MIELLITHDGKNWWAKNDSLAVSAPSLGELDREVGRRLREEGHIEQGKKGKVLMLFDNSTLPQWIRQYAQHYFNRIVEV